MVTNLDLTAILSFKTWISFSRQKSHLEFVNREKAVFWRKYFEKSIQQENKGYLTREENQTWTRIGEDGGKEHRREFSTLDTRFVLFHLLDYKLLVLCIGHN